MVRGRSNITPVEIASKLVRDQLQCYGIRGVPLDWFKTYLSDRTQFVQYEGSTSSERNILCGVPRGSIVGPLLFLLYHK